MRRVLAGTVATVLQLTALISLGGFVVHLLFGSPSAAATHFVIGALAAALRGTLK